LGLVQYREIAATAKTTFTIAGGYTVGSVFVYLNGILLDTADYTATNGTTVVLAAACTPADEFRTISYSTFTVSDTLARSANLADLSNIPAAQSNLGISTFVKTLLAAADQNTLRGLLNVSGYGATMDRASRAMAEAGTEVDYVMNPLMTKWAILALTPPAKTLLGTIATTYGTSRDLSGLDLTPYSSLHFVIDGVSGSASMNLTLDGMRCSEASGSAGAVIYGAFDLDLTTGVFTALVGPPAANLQGWGGPTSYSNASTTVAFGCSAGIFDAGQILVYGVR
jgi:hypothetical protein